ncbi:hypothetical protein [Hymenobacter sp. BRD67]|uniref:hypothetical protein n=1 Tax=Hymenobacter sp. BRD67 TaxID=2675877 RepID=UPI001565EE4C|nr:hypothetical protein [Hymenobacter sp. BRD67]QKG52535.1 hypothetical protein GKZ67_07910 [Hymenobacter sp. BRD67]
MTYIQFDAPRSNSQETKDGLIKKWLKKALLSIITIILPMANPDFNDEIDDVVYWLVECDDETGIPEREIGLNKEGQVILKMPCGDNIGYWTDNNLLLKDFREHFVVFEISKEFFECNWESFDKLLTKNN